tara:strand:- start:18668 stop:19276 length:609 start_codon:yes stop_codon:yes gene_type:complete
MKSPIEVFSEWVSTGKDEGMEKNHAGSVNNMIEFSTNHLDQYSFIDAGCGNGWVIRALISDIKCKKAIGVDGSQKMIEKARKLDDKGEYFCDDLINFIPDEKVDIVHSMEVFYYFKKPRLLIEHIYTNWIKNGGRLIIGVDFYTENKPSHSWQKDNSISIMKLFTKEEWKSFFKKSGFKEIVSWYYGKDDEWNGTLIVSGVK